MNPFSTSPNVCHRTTLLNTDVPNCYVTLEFITIRLLSLQFDRGCLVQIIY